MVMIGRGQCIAHSYMNIFESIKLINVFIIESELRGPSRRLLGFSSCRRRRCQTQFI